MRAISKLLSIVGIFLFIVFLLATVITPFVQPRQRAEANFLLLSGFVLSSAAMCEVRMATNPRTLRSLLVLLLIVSVAFIAWGLVTLLDISRFDMAIGLLAFGLGGLGVVRTGLTFLRV
jgi:hypothetical protein